MVWYLITLVVSRYAKISTTSHYSGFIFLSSKQYSRVHCYKINSISVENPLLFCVLLVPPFM
jgi:hypothetical protein